MSVRPPKTQPLMHASGTRPELTETESAEVRPLGRIVLRGAAFASAGYVLEQCLTVSVAIVLAHLVTPREFGIYGSATLLLGYAAMFADSGLQSAVIQRRDRVAEAASTAFAANVVSGLGLALLAVGSAPLLGKFFHSTTISWVGAAMAGTVALNSLMLVPDALLQRNFSFMRRLFVSPSAVLTYGIVATLLCAHGLGVWGLVLGRYGSICVELLVIWSVIDWRPHSSAMSIAMWRSLARYGRHIFATSFLNKAPASVMTALLARFVGLGAVGQFRYATTMISLPARSGSLALRMSSSRPSRVSPTNRERLQLCIPAYTPLGGDHDLPDVGDSASAGPFSRRLPARRAVASSRVRRHGPGRLSSSRRRFRPSSRKRSRAPGGRTC